MTSTLIKIALPLGLAFLFSACASKTVQPTETAISPQTERQYQCTDNDMDEDSHSDGCEERVYVRDDHHHHDNAGGGQAAGIFGYVIFRVVVEGIVRALVHR